ncbi:hypothetical protein BD410DRAFT_514991 [Rickenella mellea]|uniref:F-box domain-containing protein n=1 Tax=Rickenella mellea TaxID=50990 RepID=A0A4Y7PR33_9AGAM|nr:hypothetical protein BD410DRAFT_514991 [Rickenella mellea]
MDVTLIGLILPGCGNLIAFGWESREGSPYSTTLGLSTDEDLMRSIPLGISVLRWNRPSFSNLFTSLRNHMALRQLCISRIQSSSEDHLVTLPSLTHLETRDMVVWSILHRLDMPSISHLKVDWEGAYDADIERFGFDPRNIHHFPDSIRHFRIQIDVFTLQFTSFSPIIAPFPNLETFSYELNMQTDNVHMNPDWIGIHHRTLQHVGIQCRIFSSPWADGFTFRWGRFLINHIKELATGHAHLPLLPNVSLSIVWVFRNDDATRREETDNPEHGSYGLSTARIKFKCNSFFRYLHETGVGVSY